MSDNKSVHDLSLDKEQAEQKKAEEEFLAKYAHLIKALSGLAKPGGYYHYRETKIPDKVPYCVIDKSLIAWINDKFYDVQRLMASLRYSLFWRRNVLSLAIRSLFKLRKGYPHYGSRWSSMKYELKEIKRALWFKWSPPLKPP